MEPIDLDDNETALVHVPWGTEGDDPHPQGSGWWLHFMVPEAREGVGGLWLLYRRARQPAAEAASEPEATTAPETP